MTAQMFHEGMAAKVLGTKNLHEATASLPLDFFTMVSSFGTFYAFPTQSTYLAANNFLNYFARYRRKRGLPASAFSLGFISDLGAVTQDAVTVNLFARTKSQTGTESQVLRLLEPAFVRHSDQPSRQQQWSGQSEDPLSEANIIAGVDPAVLAEMKREETKAAQVNSSAPRWYRDTHVSVMLRALDDAWRHQTGDDLQFAQDLNAIADKSPAAQLRHQFRALVRKVQKNDNEVDSEHLLKTVTFVADTIRSMVASMFFIDTSAVHESNTITTLGIDCIWEEH